MGYTFECLVCSTPFEATHPYAEMCSGRCRERRRRARAASRQIAAIERAAAALAAFQALAGPSPDPVHTKETR